MYHPYVKHTYKQNHPYALYKALGSRPRHSRGNRLSRDNPRLRQNNQHTTGLKGISGFISDELHPYQQFVEGFSGCHNNAFKGRWVNGNKSEGLVALFKEDFQVLPNKSVALYHPRFVNKTAFVVFVVKDCQDCQDTKQMWQAYAIEAHTLIGGNGPAIDTTKVTKVCTLNVESLMFKQRDGELVDYVGPFNTSYFRTLLRKTCFK